MSDEAVTSSPRCGATHALLIGGNLTGETLCAAVLADARALVPSATSVRFDVDAPGIECHADWAKSGAVVGHETVDAPVLLDGAVVGRLTVRGTPGEPLSLAEIYAIELLAAQCSVAVSEIARMRIEAAAIESRRWFEATFELAPVGIAHVGLDGRFLRINDQFCRIVGHDGDALLQDGFQRITHPDDLAADIAHVEQLLANRHGRYMMEKRYLRPDGSDVWANLTVALVCDPAGEPDFFVSVIEDLSEVKRAHSEATLDPLTGLLNRRGLMAEATAELAVAAHAGTSIAVIYIDLDDFKEVNDDFGHDAGDACLVGVARALREATRPTDLIARMGGDEFLLLLPGCGLEQAQRAVLRIRALMAGLGGDDGWRIHGSFGVIARVPQADTRPEQLIVEADRMMFVEKRAGKLPPTII